MSSARWIYLDAGRGLAALVVVHHHLMVFYDREMAALIGDESLLLRAFRGISEWNVTAILFFFFISGWSISLAVERLGILNGIGPWQLYLLQRARRILPMFLLSLLWAGGLSWAGERNSIDTSFYVLVGNILFLDTPASLGGLWFPPFAGNGPLWTLSNEVWYYISLPVFYWAVYSRIANPLVRIDAALLGSFVVGIAAIGANAILPNPFFLFATLWPLWIVGYVYGASFGQRPIERRVVFWLSLMALVTWSMALEIRSDTLRILNDGCIVALCVVLLVKIVRWQTQLTRLNYIDGVVRLFGSVGRGSYTIYVLHYPLLLFLASRRAELGGLATSLLGLGMLIASAPYLETRVYARVNQWFALNRPRVDA
ncbi:acyltransferase [Hyphomicrobium sp. ghe19]|uniref:acyltransferase family protein n=1 Tax=Hyphomicrobium sp. ghe19 TaxID=2682968 RepID=UPI0013678ACD|nr:hypothetical protein HYPP_02281 [Hyphomicrobium sp. ghe19]